MAYWHEDNPWRDKVVYIPVKEMAESLSHAAVERRVYTPNFPVLSPEQIVAGWNKLGNAIDAYILPSDRGDHQVGVRYGSAPDAYLSIYIPDLEAIDDLIHKYTGRYGLNFE